KTHIRSQREGLELLSPAGDWDCLIAAEQNGADAVYLGVKEFNARLYTRNFTIEELGKVVNHAHYNGVRVYLTLNTLVKNHEIEAFFNTVSKAYSAGVDGVIIQHISFLEIIKRNFPGLAVFMSTQAAIGNASGAALVRAADRVILPRELPLDEVKKFIKTGVRAEVFVHGALCFSYSGMCLFSSFVSSRSGNRGSCAQLCRQKYNGTYPLSTKELCLVGQIPELIKAGVKGFKIEGRMRSPLYVAVATRLYRKAIDSYLNDNFTAPQKEMEEIEVVFNREFTEGFLTGSKDLISPQKPMNRGALLGEAKNGQILLRRPVAVGDGIGIWNGESVNGGIIKEMLKDSRKIGSAAGGDEVSFGLKINDGAKVYLTSSPRIKIKPDFTVKRPVIEAPKRKRIQVVYPEIKLRQSSGHKLLVKAYSLDEAKESAAAGADMVFLDIFSPEFPDRPDWHEKALIGAYLPRIMTESELNLAMERLRDKSPAAVLTGNPGFLPRRVQFNVPVFVDYSMNTFNDLDIRFIKNYNATPLISPELSLNEMAQLMNKDVVVFCHGDIVMVNCKIDPGAVSLTDEKTAVFPVRREDGYWQILNSHPFGLFDAIHNLREYGFKQYYIDAQGKGAESVKLYRKILNREVVTRKTRAGYTSGHLYKPVD
ncbi:MAG: U32 family peptidase, partial [Dehalococcoidales bacterium]|nr:U32 family peptidase [Dehalococcoidales bacterium]